MKEKTPLGIRLEQIRNEAHLSKEEFATKLGFGHYNSYANVLTGKNSFSMAAVMELHNNFPNYSLDWLLLGRGASKIAIEANLLVANEPQAGYNSNVLLERVKGLEEQIRLKDEIISLLKR